ncbi:hypothetical protein AVEN_156838-1 [Araneus ventricosus]|uniref:Uncharacterized protein n=1 Tax=Araneus ventricosus TaxID=182803 RepID=A0A4Y2TYL7_ARAVE|nr:hypothetical protein AVEN_156838-1 [Araneus ventricosus]
MADNADLLARLADKKKSIEAGQEEMKKEQEEMKYQFRTGQERMEQEMKEGQEEMKNQIKDEHREIRDVQRKIEGVEDTKFKGKPRKLSSK